MADLVESKNNKSKFPKSPTGILGLDDITNGGLPQNRPTLLIGKPGCGKTVMAIEFLVNGIVMFNEPGVFMTFEESADELELNVQSFSYNLNKHIEKNQLYLEHLQIERTEIVEAGKYSIEGLFVRLQQAFDKVKAKRVVLDSLDTLFFGLDNHILRSEFKRLFSWLKEKKVTALITAEMGDAFFTRMGLEEYVADCVIILDNRVTNQIATRRLRVAKYRGSDHGNNEYPYIIDTNGITVFPIISEAIEQKSSSEKISSGIDDLDEMLDNNGFYLGSSILVSGSAGTGKTSVATSFAYNVSKNSGRILYCAFEEAPNQIIRNMKSIGIALEPLVESDLLHFYYARPTLQNLELHFISIKKMIKDVKPSVIILDPITNLMTEGPNSDIRSMLTRFVDYLKTEQITVMFTAAITVGSIARNPSDEGISSMVDTWIMVQDTEKDGVRNRNLYVMKSRGMSHSKEERNFIISSKGIKLIKMNRKVKSGNGNSDISEKGKEESLNNLIESGHNGNSEN
jgi:circadian clock protein KaiC